MPTTLPIRRSAVEAHKAPEHAGGEFFIWMAIVWAVGMLMFWALVSIGRLGSVYYAFDTIGLF